MAQESMRKPLELQGFEELAILQHDLSTSFLYEDAGRRRDGRVAHLGPLVTRTGRHRGHAPNDKLVVREPSSEEKVGDGPSNPPLTPERFEALRRRMLGALQTVASQTGSPCRRRALREQVEWLAELSERSLASSDDRSRSEARRTRVREALEGAPSSSRHEG